MQSIRAQLTIPSNTQSTSITEQEGEFIYTFLKTHTIHDTLEVGFGYGCSTAYILSATHSPHIVIDVCQENYQNLGLANIKKLSLHQYLRFENDYSHNVLPKLYTEGVRLNFAFIDGGHKFDEIFVDFYYVDLMLNIHGYVLFHDSWMRSTQHVVSWIKNNKKNYHHIPTPVKNLVLFQKTGPDCRSWTHFKGFGTIKGVLRQTRFEMMARK